MPSSIGWLPDSGLKLPERFSGDEPCLKQLLIKLTKNALKYTEGGIVKILVGYEEKKEMLFVSVIDTGEGMSAETVENLFY